LYDRCASLGWAIDSELEKQIEHIESIVAEIVEAVGKLHDKQAAGEINQRLKRFLERRD
jgi:hypothetical protein